MVKVTLVMMDNKIWIFDKHDDGYFNQFIKLLQRFLLVPNIVPEWESKELLLQKRPPFTAIEIRSLELLWMKNSKIRLESKGSFLKQDKVTFTRNNVINSNNLINLFIVYE